MVNIFFLNPVGLKSASLTQLSLDTEQVCLGTDKHLLPSPTTSTFSEFFSFIFSQFFLSNF